MSRILIATLLITTTSCLADIRPEPLSAVETPTTEVQDRGRELLTRAAEAQGAEAFRRYASYKLEIEDHWKGLLGRVGNPWPDNLVHAELSYRTNSFDGQAKFLDGKKAGWTWGMQSSSTYEKSPDGELTFTKNSDGRFIIAAIHYLNEFVFRDHRDKVVAYGGTETIDGVRFERVYVTWKGMEPTKRHDQYVAYIDAQTGLLRKLQYTVRQYAGFVEATVHFDDFAKVSGVLVPRRQSITGKPTDSPDDYLHRITVKHLEFGTPPVATFDVDKRPMVGGGKRVATN